MAEDWPTIFALSSAPGRAGVAVVRISGPAASLALTRLGGPTDRPREARLARLVDPESGRSLDRGLTIWFPAPRSFTGEDVAELHLHGGRAVVEAVLAALARSDGLAPAGPGDFTRRAFANGKLDLTAVEGLADLVAAETEAQRIQAFRQSEGALGRLYESWRDRLVASLAHVEAEIDFADEEIPGGLIEGQRCALIAVADEIAAHLADGRRGERLRDGFRVVIAGPPNAGKSSLLNALARRDAAIVAPEPGTTRDVIEVALDLAGYPVVVSDTAGIRASVGAVESEGIRRARSRMESADLVLWLRDGCLGETAAPAPAGLAAPVREVWTKADLRPAEGCAAPAVSALTGQGMGELAAMIGGHAAAGLEGGAGEGAAITRVRHRRALELAEGALRRAATGPLVAEVIAEELRVAAAELGRLTGRVDVEDLLDVIFADFCIGK